MILLSHPEVKEAAVVGIPNLRDGSHPMGIVVLKSGAKVTQQELLNFYNGKKVLKI